MIISFVSSTNLHHSLFANNMIMNPMPMLVTVLLLSIGACWFGYLISELFVYTCYQGALFVHPDHNLLFDNSLSLSLSLPILTLLFLIPIRISLFLLVGAGSSGSYASLLNHFNLFNGSLIHCIL